jgi:hypothetical protein
MFFNGAPVTGISVGQGNMKNVSASGLFFRAWGHASNGRDVTSGSQWISSDPNIATVSNGSIHGISLGTATVTVRSGPGLGSILVTVTTAPALVSIAVTPQSPAIGPGGSQQFSATGTYADSSTRDLTNAVVWSSSATGVASINNAGLASATGNGTTTIAAMLGGISGSTSLSVGIFTLPPDRRTIWNPGMMSKGGIPSAIWPVCNAKPLTPIGGGADDSVQINNAIANCGAGTVVQLGPGVFIMGQGNYVSINKSVVLRGAGAGITILENPLNTRTTLSNDVEQAVDTTPIVAIGLGGRFGNSDGDGHCNGLTPYDPAFMQLLTADGSKGSYSVTVANGSIFSAGQFVLLDETSGASWQPDVAGLSTSIWASPDYAVEWQAHNPARDVIDDPIQTGVTPSAANNFAGSGNGSDAACWFSRQDRPQSEIKEIASVSGSTVTFTSPLHKTYRVSHYAELNTFTGGNQQLVNAGIERLTAVGGGDGAVVFENAAYSWAKNIEVTTWYGEGVSLDRSFRVELRDSYIHDAAWAEPGGKGYAISIVKGSAELLIENNISIRANKVMVARASGTASVVGYNYMDEGYIATVEGFIESGINGSHMVGPHHMLFEGNRTFSMDSDDTHGNATYHTFFRNWATTTRASFQSDYTGNTIDDLNTPSNGPKRAVGMTRYTYWMSFVGNILGQAGYTTAAHGYVDDFTGTDLGGVRGMMWLLGWNSDSPYTPDPNVASTTLRDGNWDWYLGSQTWLTSTPAMLPDSFYLPGKPGFFGSNPWPWVDPATGTIYTLPAKARYDAGTPNIVP